MKYVMLLVGFFALHASAESKITEEQKNILKEVAHTIVTISYFGAEAEKDSPPLQKALSDLAKGCEVTMEDKKIVQKGEECMCSKEILQLQPQEGFDSTRHNHLIFRVDEKHADTVDVTEIDATLKTSLALEQELKIREANLTAKSKKYGDITIKGIDDGTMTGGHNARYELKVGDIEVVLAYLVDGEKVEYTLNGESIPEDEFIQYLPIEIFGR